MVKAAPVCARLRQNAPVCDRDTNKKTAPYCEKSPSGALKNHPSAGVVGHRAPGSRALLQILGWRCVVFRGIAANTARPPARQPPASPPARQPARPSGVSPSAARPSAFLFSACPTGQRANDMCPSGRSLACSDLPPRGLPTRPWARTFPRGGGTFVSKNIMIMPK